MNLIRPTICGCLNMTDAVDCFSFMHNRKTVRQKSKRLIRVIKVATADNHMTFPRGSLIAMKPIRKNLGAGH